MKNIKHIIIVFTAILIGVFNTNTTLACNQFNNADKLQYTVKKDTTFDTALRFEISSVNTGISYLKNNITPSYGINSTNYSTTKYKSIIRLFLTGEMQVYSSLYLLNNVLRL